MSNIITEYFVSMYHLLKLVFTKCGWFFLAMYTIGFIGNKIENLKYKVLFIIPTLSIILIRYINQF